MIFGILWVGVPVVDLATSDPSPLQIAVVAVALPAFAALFLLTVMERRPPIAGLVGMLVTAAVLTLAHDSFGLLFGYPVAAAGVRLPERENVLAVLAITAIAAATIAISGGADGAVFWGVTSAVFTTGAVWMLIGGLVRANSQLRDARAELAELAVAEERLRFARDLHDLLGQDLSLIALKTELAGKLLPDRVEQAATEVEQIQTLTRSALAQVREAVGGYRQPTLASELAGARMALEAAGIELRVEAPTEPLPPRGRDGARVGGSGRRHQRHSPQRGPSRGDRDSAGHGDRRARDQRRRPGRRTPRRPRSRRTERARGRDWRNGRSRCVCRRRVPAARQGAGLAGRERGVIRVLLAEDQAMVRGALASLLALEADIQVVAEVGRGDEVLHATRQAAPDVALLDIGLPGIDGLEAAAVLGRELPNVRVVMLTTFNRPGYLRQAMEAGVVGFLLKDAPASELADAIRAAAAGERVVDPGLAAAALSQGENPLTAREREVLAKARSHGTVAELAAALHLSPGTTRNHLSTVMQKLGARSRIEAIRLAEERGWL